MTTLLKVLLIKPGQEPVPVFIEPTITEMMKLIGDDKPKIERIMIGTGLGIFCDEDGTMKELPPNRWFEHHQLVGPFFICRDDGQGGEQDLTDADVERWTKKFALSQSRL